MCFENLNMPWNMSRAISSLLLCSIALQGLQAEKMIHFEKLEATMGQNISLPCILDDTFDTNIFQLEWRKEESKLIVYHKDHGAHYYRHGLALHPEKGDHNELRGSYLQLSNAQVNDSGTYVCEFTTHPLGSISREIRLKVKDLTSQNTNQSSTGVYVPTTGRVEANPTLETGQNVSSSDPSSQAMTTKPYATESRNESSTVRPITGSSETTLGLESHPGSTERTTNATEEWVETHPGSTESTANVTEEWVETHHGSTESTANVTEEWVETHHGSTERAANVTEEHVPDDVYHQHTSSSTTPEMETNARDDLTKTSPNLSSSRLTTEDKTVVVMETSGTGLRFWWLAVVLLLVACIMLGVFYRRHTIQKRQDGPPPFKPPPPPKKYTSVKPHQIPMDSSCSLSA